jgi:octaprenyl-diphosphate synthase
MPARRAAISAHASDPFAPCLAALRKLLRRLPLDASPASASWDFVRRGKWLRPRFLFAAATDRHGPPTGDAFVRAAACIELVHSACLVHDDIVDRCEKRRGQHAFHVSHGSRVAVETGTYLVHLALELIAPLSLFVRRRMAEVSGRVARGELTEAAATFDLSTDPDARLEVMQDKTASVFALACEIGGFLAGRPAAERRRLHDFGMAIGVLYQLADDLDDLFASSAMLGRAPGADLREGVLSLPLVYGLAGPLRSAFVDAIETARTVGTTDSLLERVRTLSGAGDALPEVALLARRLGNIARTHLSGVPSSIGTEWLAGSLETMTVRIEAHLRRDPATGIPGEHRV